MITLLLSSLLPLKTVPQLFRGFGFGTRKKSTDPRCRWSIDGAEAAVMSAKALFDPVEFSAGQNRNTRQFFAGLGLQLETYGHSDDRW